MGRTEVAKRLAVETVVTFSDAMQTLDVCDDDEELARKAIDLAGMSGGSISFVVDSMHEAMGKCPAIECRRLLLPGRKLCKSCRKDRERW